LQGIMPAMHGYVELDLQPGDYAAICFIPSPSHEGKAHMELGMMVPFRVK